MRIHLFISFLLIGFSAIAFSQAYDGTVTYDKKKQQAILIDYDYPQDAVENAIMQKIEKSGNKAAVEKGMFNRDKGFVVFKNALVADISDKTLDYIIKVERKSKKEKDETTLYLALIDDAGNTIAEMDADEISKAKSFLNNLLPEIEEANLELNIKSQTDAVAKAEKKLKELQDDQKKMEKKIEDLQDDLKKNAKNQEKQQEEIENQKQGLEILKGKERRQVIDFKTY